MVTLLVIVDVWNLGEFTVCTVLVVTVHVVCLDLAFSGIVATMVSRILMLIQVIGEIETDIGASMVLVDHRVLSNPGVLSESNDVSTAWIFNFKPEFLRCVRSDLILPWLDIKSNQDGAEWVSLIIVYSGLLREWLCAGLVRSKFKAEFLSRVLS